jgi:DNA adenine methylase
MGSPKLSGPLPYVGSKQQLMPAIIPVVPPHRIYIEPFVGGGALFFTKPPAPVSIINDADKALAQFYRDFSCKKLEECKKITSVCSFSKKAREAVRKGKGNVCEQLAARRFSIVSDVTGGMKTDECKIHPVVTKQLEKKCADYESRLKSAKILSTDFKEVVQKYDRKDAFIFMDPPYPKTTKPYKGNGVTPAEVCAVARNAKGRAIVTYNDLKEVRTACKGLYIKSVPSKHRSKRVTKGKVGTRELLISNFRIPGSVKT